MSGRCVTARSAKLFAVLNPVLFAEFRAFGCCVTARRAKLLPLDSQTSQIVGFGDSKASPLRFLERLHPRGASGVLSPANAKLLALSVSVFAVLLNAQ